jgi:DNA-binding transcriptional MerR regulator
METKLLKIGEVASHSQLSVKTVRYYEDLGLLASVVKRSENGYRLFYPDVYNRLAFIKRAQALGLSLQEIEEILVIHDQGELPCGVVKNRLLFKLNQINHQIEALELLKSELQGILSAWQDKPSPEKISHTICPNIQS